MNQIYEYEFKFINLQQIAICSLVISYNIVRYTYNSYQPEHLNKISAAKEAAKLSNLALQTFNIINNRYLSLKKKFSLLYFIEIDGKVRQVIKIVKDQELLDTKYLKDVLKNDYLYFQEIKLLHEDISLKSVANLFTTDIKIASGIVACYAPYLTLEAINFIGEQLYSGDNSTNELL